MYEVRLGRRPKLPPEGGPQPHTAAAVLLYYLEKIQSNLM